MKPMKLLNGNACTGSMNLMRHMDGSARNGIKVKGSTAFSSTGKLSNNSQNSNVGAIMTDGTIQTSGEAAAVTVEMKKGLDGYTDFSPEKLGEADTVSGVEKHDDPVCSAIVEGLKAFRNLVEKDSAAVIETDNRLREADAAAARDLNNKIGAIMGSKASSADQQ